MSYRAWAITIRPRNGICDDRVSDYIDWIEKSQKIVGAYGVLEKCAEERHLHLALFFEEARRKGDVNKQIERIFSRRVVEVGELKVLRLGTRILYSDDFIQKYLDKDDDTQVVINCVPPNTAEYYPSQEEQDAVQLRSNAVDQYYHSLASKFNEWKARVGVTERDVQVCRWWMGVAMFGEKTIRVIADERKFNQIVNCLYRYTTENQMCYVDTSTAMGQYIWDKYV